jgi:hypothetical protein
MKHGVFSTHKCTSHLRDVDARGVSAAYPQLLDCFAVATTHVEHGVERVVREVSLVEQLVHEERGVRELKISMIARLV